MFCCGIIFFVRVYIKNICKMLKIFKGGAVICQESVKFVVRVRFQETMYPIQTDIQEENGMQTSRLLESMTTEQLEEPTCAQDASDQTKSTVPSNLKKSEPAYAGSFF